jgi:hypothetical protein
VVSAATDPEWLDVAELAASLLAEVRHGIAARTEVEGSDLEVIEARVRVGEPAQPEAGGVTNPAVLTRPGLDEVGWQVELVLRREELAAAHAIPGPPDGSHGPALPAPSTAVGLWRSRPTADLKGIDRVRSAELAAHGVRTIGEVLDLDEDRIAAIVAATRTTRLLEVWVRAALLATPVPTLPTTPADRRSLAWLAGRSPTLLRDDLGVRSVSRSGATALFDLLAAWSTALDRAVLATVSLGEVRAAARE